jgi:hypothetical protein
MAGAGVFRVTVRSSALHLANRFPQSTRRTNHYRFSAGGIVDSLMNESSTNTLSGQQQIPEEVAIEIRRLAHDLSNSLEIIVQTSYLLSMAELKEPASSWLRMLDSGVQKALELNQELREYVKKNTPL